LRLWNLDKDNEINKSLNKNRETLYCIEQFFALDYHIKEKFTPGKGVKVYKNIYVNYEPEFIWPSLTDSFSNENGYCYALKQQAGILVDGTVVPCCLDGEGMINLGSIKELSFKEIINNNISMSIYNGFKNRKAVELLCKKCKYKGKFG
jgi:radical SAM protein with 4Fe4S-binding SPASM domain